MLVLLYVGMSILNVCVEEEVLFFDGFDEYTCSITNSNCK